jgi:surfeit locus 1 family protein
MEGTIAVSASGNSGVSGYRFRPRPIPTIAMIIIAVGTLLLGNWQTRRAEERIAMQERLDRLATGVVQDVPEDPVSAPEWAQHRVIARGEFVSEGLILVDNRLYRGAAGYHVVMPLRLAGGRMHVLVNRGWVAAGARRDVLPPIPTPKGPVVIEGIASIPNDNPYELAKSRQANAESGPIRQNLVLDRVSEEQRLLLQPFVILQTGNAADAFVRDWPRPDARSDTNRAYALQWYAMSAVAVIMWVVLNLKKADDKSR